MSFPYTADQVVEAFGKVQRTPAKLFYVGEGCCCGLGALYLVQEGLDVDFAEHSDIMNKLNLTEPQMLNFSAGFIAGLEGEEKPYTYDEAQVVGFESGKRVKHLRTGD